MPDKRTLEVEFMPAFKHTMREGAVEHFLFRVTKQSHSGAEFALRVSIEGAKTSHYLFRAANGISLASSAHPQSGWAPDFGMFCPPRLTVYLRGTSTHRDSERFPIPKSHAQKFLDAIEEYNRNNGEYPEERNHE